MSEGALLLECRPKCGIRIVVVSQGATSKSRGKSPGNLFYGGELRELSIFVDESGEFGPVSKYYLITLVFHDQSEDISAHLSRYRCVLSDCGMKDITFHLSPLMNGHREYAGLSLGARKRHLSKFLVFTQNLPFAYRTFLFKKMGFDEAGKLLVRMKRDITSFLFDHLDFFQAFDKVKVYYDDGQQAVSEVLHEAIRYTLSKNAYLFKDAHPCDYCLSQVADFVCGIELTAVKYDASEATATDAIFFGGSNSFKKNYLKKIRKKKME